MDTDLIPLGDAILFLLRNVQIKRGEHIHIANPVLVIQKAINSIIKNQNITSKREKWWRQKEIQLLDPNTANSLTLTNFKNVCLYF